MTKLTDKELQEFWERCGFKQIEVDRVKWSLGDGDIYRLIWVDDKKEYQEQELPPLDLNNLFKYAVPKLYKEYTHLEILFEHGVHGNITTSCTIKFSNYITRQMEVIGKGEAYDKDPALALYQAIQKARKSEK